MAVVEGLQICTTLPFSARASAIIRGMERLLDARHKRQVTRRQFLARWGRLRKALRITDEYQQLRRNIELRCGGVCEVCRDAGWTEVHHKVRVAWAPGKALDLGNCVGVCVACHKRIEKRA